MPRQKHDESVTSRVLQLAMDGKFNGLTYGDIETKYRFKKLTVMDILYSPEAPPMLTAGDKPPGISYSLPDRPIISLDNKNDYRRLPVRGRKVA